MAGVEVRCTVQSLNMKCEEGGAIVAKLRQKVFIADPVLDPKQPGDSQLSCAVRCALHSQRKVLLTTSLNSTCKYNRCYRFFRFPMKRSLLQHSGQLSPIIGYRGKFGEQTWTYG